MKWRILAAILMATAAAMAADLSKPPTLEDAQKLFETGEYEKALEAFQTAAAAAGLDAVSVTHANLAAVECLDAIGWYKDALALCQKVLTDSPKTFRARFWLGRLQETTGHKAQAIETYSWFESQVRGSQRPADAEAITYAAMGLDRYSILTGKPAAYANFILHELYQGVQDTIDPQYWPARVASGDLLLSKYNKAQAREDYLAALKINPRCTDAEVGLAAIELQDWQWEKCEQRIARALRKNPRHMGALVTQAALLMAERQDSEAAAALDKALGINPNHLEALSWMAAVQLRLRFESRAREFIDRARKINPEYGLLYSIIADGLAAQRQFKEAESYYLHAIEISPELADPRTSMGMMYMETGREQKARLTLDAAFRIDGFNQRTLNTLNLLDKLEKFGRVESQHFVIKFDAASDHILAPYFTEYLESIYPQLTRKFAFELPEKTIVEIFPAHNDFAVRVTAMPWLMTVGACTGRVIAMDAPRKDARLTPFDWKDVLRHEFTHVITLTATDNRIAHWLTEGLATREQPQPRDWMMTGIFIHAVRRGELIPVAKLDWGFVRPRKPTDRALAYAEAELICEYITEKYGHPKILALLQAYRAGEKQTQAFPEVFGLTESQFDAAFSSWAKKQLESWGFESEPLRSVVKIRQDLSARPNDPILLGELAEAQYGEGKGGEAQKTAADCLQRDPQTRRALAVTAAVLAENQKWDEVKPILEQLQKVDTKSRVAARLLGEIALKKNQLDEAIIQFSRLTRLCPADPRGHKGLAEAYLRQGKSEEALPSLLAEEIGNTTDLLLPQRIAAIYRRLGKTFEAIHVLEHAMRLDPYDVTLHQQLAVLHLAQKDYPAVLRELRVNCELQPTVGDHFARLANVYKLAGDAQNALASARKAVALDPQSPAAAIIESLEKNVSQKVAPR